MLFWSHWEYTVSSTMMVQNCYGFKLKKGGNGFDFNVCITLHGFLVCLFVFFVLLSTYYLPLQVTIISVLLWSKGSLRHCFTRTNIISFQMPCWALCLVSLHNIAIFPTVMAAHSEDMHIFLSGGDKKNIMSLQCFAKYYFFYSLFHSFRDSFWQ